MMDDLAELRRNVPEDEVFDFGKHVLPHLVGRMRGWPIQDYLLDIGTMDKYAQAQRDIHRLEFPRSEPSVAGDAGRGFSGLR